MTDEREGPKGRPLSNSVNTDEAQNILNIGVI